MAKRRVDEEYATQFYGFSPESVKLEMKKLFDATLTWTSENFKEKLSAFGIEDEEELSNSLDIVKKLYYDSAMKNISKLEKVVNDFFYFGKHILLPEDQIHRQDYSKEEEDSLDKELEDLKQTLKAFSDMEKVLQVSLEVTRNHDAVFEELSQISESFENILSFQEEMGKALTLLEKVDKEIKGIFPQK